MANFGSYQDILPDPNNLISHSGSSDSNNTGAAFGPGFATVKFTANQPTQISRTNSGRVVARSTMAHSWKLNITYNKITRDEFEPIFSFLMSRQGRLNPFFVELPQYLASRNSTFAATQPGTLLTVNESSSVPAGRTYFRASWGGSIDVLPFTGDVFTITDPNNSNHTKMYMVTRVERNNDFNTSLDASTNPSATPMNVRIHFSPPLVHSVDTSVTSTLDFVEPRLRVIQAGDVTEYSLGVDGLYQFGLNLEEAAP